MDKVLNLTLKKKWFDMILSGEKKEEYRELKRYWWARLIQDHKNVWDKNFTYSYGSNIDEHEDIYQYFIFRKHECPFMQYDVIEFKNGYGKNAPIMRVKCIGIDVDYAKQEWSEGFKNWAFVIKLGEIIETKNINPR